VRIFTTPERRKHRRRLITHTPGTNESPSLQEASSLARDILSSHPSWKNVTSSARPQNQGVSNGTNQIPTACRLRTPVEVRDRVLFPFGVCVDFASYFHHFLLPKNLRVWCFRAFGVDYELTTIPTGANFCPAIAQIYSTALCTLVQHHFPNIAFDVYIDNIRFLGHTREYVLGALKYFFSCANLQGVDINEEYAALEKGDLQRYEFLGVKYDHINQTTELASHLREKLLAASIPETPTLREVLSTYGLLNFCSSVMNVCRSGAYYATKFLRRRTGDILDAPTRLWPTARSTLEGWIHTIATTDPVKVAKVSPAAEEMFTDASDKGFGAVVFFADGHTAIFAGTWTEHQRTRSINVREAWAVLFALQHLDLRGCACDIHIDNTSALCCITKGSSRNYDLNCAAGAIRKEPQFHLVHSMSYVRSDKNRADLPSRLGLAVAGEGMATTWLASSPFLWSSWYAWASNAFGPPTSTYNSVATASASM
jgi:hypothetical protein